MIYAVIGAELDKIPNIPLLHTHLPTFNKIDDFLFNTIQEYISQVSYPPFGNTMLQQQHELKIQFENWFEKN